MTEKKEAVSTSKTWVEISVSAIENNIRIFRSSLRTEAELMAVIKSNAYGHGLLEIARIARRSGVKWFGVDSLSEGLILRKAGFKESILIMGYTRPSQIEVVIKNNLDFVAYDQNVLQTVRRLSEQGLLKKSPANIHLKVETGTVRQGLAGQALIEYARQAMGIKGLKVRGVYTHFANIEDTTDHTLANLQLKNFNQALKQLKDAGCEPMIKHTACSAAALLFPETHFNLIRMGISLYGYWSSKETRAVAQKQHKAIALMPALTWKTIIAQIKDVPKGTAVGYGQTEKVTRKSKIAVLPVGYWDGYDRKLSGMGNVLIRGRRCKVVGRICMNMMMVDVTDVKGAAVEDEVVLLGSQKKDMITAEEFAGKVGTINYEVVTRINPWLPRISVK